MATETSSEISYRSATAEDQQAVLALLEAAGLPARAVEEYIESFLVAEADGRVVACGCCELRQDTAVLRAVAVAAEMRGSGIGRGLSERLLETARRAGVRDVYLFTGSSISFWKRLGFDEITMEDWRQPARECWQYRYISSHPEIWQQMELHTMALHLG